MSGELRMIIRVIIYGIIALIGFGSFITAAIFLTKGHNAEWVTLILAPISGICLAIVAKGEGVPEKLRPSTYYQSLRPYLIKLKIFN